MLRTMVAALALLVAPGTTWAAVDLSAGNPPAQPGAGINQDTGRPGSAGPKDDGIVQRSTQPNAGEVRPGSPDGDSPSASAGTLRQQEVRRVFGLPVTAAVVIASVIVLMLLIAGLVIPGSRRRARARGNGTYGPPS